MPPESPSPPPPPPAELPQPTEQPQTAPAPPRPATWPEWFRAADFLLAALVLVGAFLATSFAIRNSDYWLHLASGRLLATGQYPVGGDPFSYTGADRPWVNSSWLFDLGVYAVQSANDTGAAAVALKAAAFALAFGLLFFLRRPGQALWPWAVAGAVGALASASFISVRPVAVSMLFLALTLLLIYRGPWQRGAWRAPVLLAVLFGVWANLDRWFLLGPLTVLLVLIGEKFDRFLTREAEPTDDPGSPFPPAPPAAGLVRAFVLGVIACLLNPMFLAALVRDPIEAVVQLFPWELGFGIPAGAADDPELASLTLSGWGVIERLFSTTSAGVHLNGVALLILFLGGLAALIADFSRLRATHIVLWVVFGAMALQSAWLIPYFALVSMPLIGGHLNGLSSRIQLGARTEPRTRLLLTGSVLGRLLSLAVLLLGVAAAYPGWLHPPRPDPVYGSVYTRPVEWAIQPDAGLVRTAKLLHDLRADGSLPDEARGLNTSVDLANYCAWFAPKERVFADGRYVFHRAEWPDLLTARRTVYGRRTPSAELPDFDELWRICEARDTGYLVAAIHSHRTDDTSLFLGSLFQLLNQTDRWALWHLDGRSAFLGRYAEAPPGRAAVERLRFDPARLAFGPNPQPVAEGRVEPPPPAPEPGWGELIASYLARPAPPPAEADDAITLTVYADHLAEQARRRWQRVLGRRMLTRAAVAGPMIALLQGEEAPIEDAQFALPVLVVRDARRAVAAVPERPESYFALAIAYRMPLAPVGEFPSQVSMEIPEAQLQVLTAQARLLARVPPPERCGTGGAVLAAQEAARLAVTYARTQQLDLAHDAIQRALSYSASLTPDAARNAVVMEVLQLLPRQKLQAAVLQLRRADRPGPEWIKLLKEIDDQFAQLVRQSAERVQRATTPVQRFQLAVQAKLPGMALQIFQSASGPGEFGGESEQIGIMIAVARLQLRAGRLEEADSTLTALGERVKEFQARHPRANMAQVYQALVGLALRLEGNFVAAADSFNAAAPPNLPPELRRLADVPLRTVRVSGGVAGATVIAPTFEQRVQVHNVLLLEAAYQYDRAMMALCDADIPEAWRRLEKAAHPQGADLAQLGDPAGLARIQRYLKLIERYGGQHAQQKARPY